MFELYENTLVELFKNKEVFHRYKQDVRLLEFSLNEQLYLVEYVLGKLSYFYNNAFLFGKTEDERMTSLQSWRDSLCVLYPSWIIHGLYRLVSGQISEYADFPPRHAVAFNVICRSCLPLYSIPVTQKLIQKQELSDQEKQDKIKKGETFLTLVKGMFNNLDDVK